MIRIQLAASLRRVAIAALLLALGGACGGSTLEAPDRAAATPAGAAEAAPAVVPVETTRPEPEPHHLCAADYSARYAGRSLLILRGGAVIFETGQNGHAADAAQALGGASQSFWGLAAVAAEADGLLDLDEPVAFTIEEFDADPVKREIRVRQLLHQTSGLEPGVAALHRDRTPDLTARALALDVIAPPGTRFQHGPSHVVVFNELLRRKLAPRGHEPESYLNTRILDPIGLSVEGWARDAAGNLDAAYGATVRPREWAKLGLLLANGGSAGSREVVPKRAIAEVLASSGPAPEFALGLWRNPSTPRSTHAFYPDGLPDLVVAAGEGNQRLYLIPSLDLVVVRTGDPDRGWRDREFLDCLLQRADAGGETPARGFSGSG